MGQCLILNGAFTVPLQKTLLGSFGDGWQSFTITFPKDGIFAHGGGYDWIETTISNLSYVTKGQQITGRAHDLNMYLIHH